MGLLVQRVPPASRMTAGVSKSGSPAARPITCTMHSGCTLALSHWQTQQQVQTGIAHAGTPTSTPCSRMEVARSVSAMVLDGFTDATKGFNWSSGMAVRCTAIMATFRCDLGPAIALARCCAANKPCIPVLRFPREAQRG